MDATTLELRVPSLFGNEKYAMDFAEDIALGMGFSAEKINDLKIAVGEACLNAIEHGHQQNKNMKVIIDFTIHASELEINVQDKGKGFKPQSITKPNIKDIVEGKTQNRRGWGMYLIKEMVDRIEFLDSKGGTHLRMVFKLPGNNSKT